MQKFAKSINEHPETVFKQELIISRGLYNLTTFIILIQVANIKKFWADVYVIRIGRFRRSKRKPQISGKLISYCLHQISAIKQISDAKTSIVMRPNFQTLVEKDFLHRGRYKKAMLHRRDHSFFGIESSGKFQLF